ncbi:response regulator [uncultured Dokdonia sp.]|uniref:response regulator n=1 Tax=uncultured Dokdonia sp. TaxID=575653 RepID=UPI00260E7648|nr:response regulator [uncultured Dokdonia sp.]
MKKKLKVLMVDDHPMILEGYKNTLSDFCEENYKLEIETASDCDEAISLIDRTPKSKPYDLAMIDVQLPIATNDVGITSGEGIAQYLRKKFSRAKVIILTMHNESTRIHNILEKVNPQGLLIKTDISFSELNHAFEQVLSQKIYYSSTVNDHLRKMVTNDVSVDQINLQILYHLSRGVRTKNLTNHINLSLSAIEKRKNQLKEKLHVKSESDERLIEEARLRGLI